MISGKRLVGMAIILSVAILPLGATAGAADMFGATEVSSWDMTADLFTARPVGLASTVLGTGTFLLSAPFSALGGNFDQSFDKLVKKPFIYTFKRPLGIF